ncbi:MAG TPA: class I SAM-dependent methyltransferase [Thermomicrobiaceae bacterium]|nr:class I SAM-dependent methyltransferase [Thermomicrobiaceae bacterium]
MQRDGTRHAGSGRSWLLSRAFDALYGPGARLYDLISRAAFGDDWAAWRRAAAELVNGEPVLDLGCGTGALVEVLSAQRGLVVGVDRSEAMLTAARRHRDGARIRLVRADARQLPFPSGTFAVVLSTFPSDYILDPLAGEEVLRVLSPDGALVVLIGGTIDRWHWWQAPRRLVLRWVYGPHSNLPAARAPFDLAGLRGDWQEVPGPQGRGWVWIARRNATVGRDS